MDEHHTSPWHQRAAEAVLRKIERVSATSQESLMPSPVLQPVYAQHIDTFLGNDEWCQKRDQLLIQSGLDTGDAAARIDAIAGQAVQMYLNGLTLRDNLMAMPAGAIAKPHHHLLKLPAPREHLANSYINHLSNQIQYALRGAGLNTHASIGLHGACIRKALAIYTEVNALGVEKFIDPVVNPHARVSAADREVQIQEHWQYCRDQLHLLDRMYGDDQRYGR